MEWTYIQQAIPQFVDAFLMTLRLSLFGIVGAIVVGLIVTMVDYFKLPGRHFANGYRSIALNTPLLIQLFFIYYGLPPLGLKVPAELTAIIGLTFLGGAYMAKVFTGGILAIDKIQIESGQAIGLSKFQLAKYVLIPQGLLFSLPGVAANIIFLIKETSIFTVIAIPEITNTTLDLIGQNYRTDEYLTMMIVAYAAILVPLSVLLTLAERKIRHVAISV
ncbi:MAG: amino acid ABC transporter permease [Lactococcus lactis]|nr:amino acid ABC transporter permease [Lactococcus lactis]MDN6035052.1 amino acid ABC transporter permease [Lactococcus lactis]